MVVATPTMMRRLSQVFTDRQASILTEVIQQTYGELVHTSDFDELGPRLIFSYGRLI